MTTQEKENLSEELEQAVAVQEAAEEELEVVIVDDTPPEDAGRPSKDAGAAEEEEELPDLSPRIQKRIDKLRYEWNEERREKERAARENAEAVKYAQSVQGENNNLRQQLSDQSKLLYSQVSAKTDAEIDTAKQRYREAHESGDADAIVDAQSNLSRLHAEKQQYMYTAPLPDDSQQQAPQQPQQHQPAPPPDAQAVQWIKDNPWFQQPGYERMSGFAVGIHQELTSKGIDPRTNPAYYETINKALKETFPQHFEKTNQSSDTPSSRRTSVVAPAKRGGGATRKVELTASQISLAKKLGVTPQQYAAQVVKEMTNG
tara:strand:- start:9313 stop:10260 length:948 start_codon:yes stop_codon:yes gene_type:complete